MGFPRPGINKTRPWELACMAGGISLAGALVAELYWLKQMMERSLKTDQACDVIKEYLPFVCENSSSNSSTSESEDTGTG